MKATLEFNLPDDKSELARANQSLEMALALWHISNLKHECEQKSLGESALYGINLMSHRIKQILEKYNLNVEELIQ
jgi:hypothetical protein